MLNFFFFRPITNGKILKIEVEHGSDRHQIILTEKDKQLTVLDMQNEIEKITAVSVKDQRLFHKSHEVSQTPFKTLQECELENNSTIKLVGEPNRLRYANFFGQPRQNVDQSGQQLNAFPQRNFNQTRPQQQPPYGQY